MKKNLKSIIAISMVLAMTSISLFAQSSKKGSAWTIKDDVDLAYDSKYYQDAKIDNFIVSSEVGYSGLSFNFAKQFKPFYLGLSYEGDLWGDITGINSDYSLAKIKQSSLKSNFNNSFKTFFGFENGHVLSFDFDIGANLESGKSVDDNTNKTTKTKKNSFELGFTGGWNNTFVKGDNTFKPFATVSYYFEPTSSEPKEAYTKVNNLGFALGTDIVKGTKDSLYSILSLEYDIEINNSTNYTSKDVKLNSDKAINNSLPLVYLVNYKVNDKLTVAGDVDLTLDFDFSKKINSNGDKVSSVFNFSADSDIYLGAKYAFVPSKFALSTGIHVNLPSVNVTNKNDYGSKIETTETKFINNWYSNLYAGFDWNITENLTMDMGTRIPLGSSNTIFNNMTVGISYRK